MTSAELAQALKLKGGFVGITRVSGGQREPLKDKGCTLRVLNRALEGETLEIGIDNTTCYGANTGMGFQDGLPNTPGGFGYFISHGRGPGYPPGERVKCSPEVGEKMLLSQPQNVMEGFDAVRIAPYDDVASADTVTALVNMDQMAALIHIFCYRRTDYDCVIAPMVSGCASVFRLPFAELNKEAPRAVIGNIDVFSRPHFGADTAFFTIPSKCFRQMLLDTDESVLISPIWKGVHSRL